MTPRKLLERAKTALLAGRAQESCSLLNRYADWRNEGGGDPTGEMDATAIWLSRQLRETLPRAA